MDDKEHKPKKESSKETKALFLKNPLDKSVNPRFIVHCCMDRKRSNSLLKKIEKNFFIETPAPTPTQRRASVDIPRKIEQVTPRFPYLSKDFK